MAELYLLDWRDTKATSKPSGAELRAWLLGQGFVVDGQVKVYANGTVQLSCEPSPEAVWPSFDPQPAVVEDTLGQLIAELLEARAELLAIPESKRTATDRLALASTALMLFGYGVEP